MKIAKTVKILSLLVLLTVCLDGFAKQVYSAGFKDGAWNKADWDMVKSWRWPYRGEWIQRENCIENKVPKVDDPKILQGKRCGETFTSMVLKQKFGGSIDVSCKMDFDYRMAPGVIFAAEPVMTDNGLEYREHVEVIVYDNGLNVWHHYFENGRQRWKLMGKLRTKFVKNTPYEAKVSACHNGKDLLLKVAVGDKVLEAAVPGFAPEYRVGVVASEGINRFYDFSVETR